MFMIDERNRAADAELTNGFPPFSGSHVPVARKLSMSSTCQRPRRMVQDEPWIVLSEFSKASRIPLKESEIHSTGVLIFQQTRREGRS